MDHSDDSETSSSRVYHDVPGQSSGGVRLCPLCLKPLETWRHEGAAYCCKDHQRLASRIRNARGNPARLAALEAKVQEGKAEYQARKQAQLAAERDTSEGIS